MENWQQIQQNDRTARTWVRMMSDFELLVIKPMAGKVRCDAFVRDPEGRIVASKMGFWTVEGARRWTELQCARLCQARA